VPADPGHTPVTRIAHSAKTPSCPERVFVLSIPMKFYQVRIQSLLNM
jgi:hypothetical protein